MNKRFIDQQVKEVYDQFPYPALDNTKCFAENWSWVDMKWIDSLLPFKSKGVPPFKRILIAGCGTGKEAFQMCKCFPNAEIVAVDYSTPAIDMAQAYQKKHPNYTNIQFKTGDLTTGNGDWAKAHSYDFISCHGVMSYIADTQNAFNTLAECLTRKGILYLGVNGATHIGVAIRQSIEYFGHSSDCFEDTLRTRQLIELFDRLRPNQEHISQASSAYLASDILNVFSLNLPLSEWLDYAHRSKLHLVSSTELILNLSKTLAPELFPLLIPKSRAEICEIIAFNNLAPFHRLIFSKSAQPTIPWTDFEALLDCEFQTTQLYTIQYPISTIDGEITLSAAISESHNIHFRWPVDNVLIKLLQQLQEPKPLRNALKSIIHSFNNNQAALIEKIFMLYQLGIIKIYRNSAKII